MAENTDRSKPSFRWATNLAGIYLVFLYGIFAVFAAFLGVANKREISNLIFTPTISAITPTPKILVKEPPKNQHVVYENFKTNVRNWGLRFASGNINFINEKLVAEGIYPNNYTIVENYNVITSIKEYYIQAEMMTDISSRNASYGMIFGSSQKENIYYLFDVNPQAGGFSLHKYLSGAWYTLIDFKYTKMNDFPEANTLSVYFNKGNIELYINGVLASKYKDDSPLYYTGIGFYINEPGYRLIVDDFFAYSISR